MSGGTFLLEKEEKMEPGKKKLLWSQTFSFPHNRPPQKAKGMRLLSLNSSVMDHYDDETSGMIIKGLHNLTSSFRLLEHSFSLKKTKTKK